MRVAVPIIKLDFKDEDAFPNWIMDVFEKLGICDPDETFTYTCRVDLSLAPPEKRDAIMEEVLQWISRRVKSGELTEEQGNHLEKLLLDTQWDLSFYVDGY